MTTDPVPDPSHVLVVDDSATVRCAIRINLEEVGYQVTEAGDGEAGIEACLADPPDVVLLDVEMPGLSGHDVLQRLKAEETLKDIPVVFLTGHAESGPRCCGDCRAVATTTVSKPFRRSPSSRPGSGRRCA